MVLANNYHFAGVRLGVKASAMSNAANYTADERLRDGRRVEIRALKPDDKAGMLDAVSHIGAQSMRRRFFGAKRGFSEAEQAYYLSVDFVNHVALVAVVEERGHATIVGGGRYCRGAARLRRSGVHRRR